MTTTRTTANKGVEDKTLGDGTLATSAPIKDTHEIVLSVSDLKSYVTYRLEQLHISRLGGNAGGSAMIAAADETGFLRAVSHLIGWAEAGKPDPASVISEEQKERYRWARDEGMPVPAEILRQL